MYYYTIEIFKVIGTCNAISDYNCLYNHVFSKKCAYHTTVLNYNLFECDDEELKSHIEYLFKYIMNVRENKEFTGGYYMSVKEEYRGTRYYYIECDLAGDILINFK